MNHIKWSDFDWPDSSYLPGVNLHTFSLADQILLKVNSDPNWPIIFVRRSDFNYYWIISPIHEYRGSYTAYPKNSLVWCFASDVDMGSNGDAKT